MASSDFTPSKHKAQSRTRRDTRPCSPDIELEARTEDQRATRLKDTHGIGEGCARRANGGATCTHQGLPSSHRHRHPSHWLPHYYRGH